MRKPIHHLSDKSRIFKERLRTGETTVGCFVNLYIPNVIEQLTQSGFDFVILDAEHGRFSRAEMENMVRACDISAMASVIRVDYDPSSIQNALDMGADGILVPMVRTAEDARAAVARAKYPPLGSRGADFYSRAYQYRKDDPRGFLTAQNEDTTVMIQVETPEAVSNLDEIMAQEGVDAIFVGAMDLSVSMGQASPATPAMQSVIRGIYDKAHTAKMPVGAVFVDQETYTNAAAQGATFLSTTIIACLTAGMTAITPTQQ